MTPWDDLIARSILTCPVGGWKPTSVAAAIEAISASAETPVVRETIGESFEGRRIQLIKAGGGPKRLLMWSQMHGDEPTHTSVLLNLLRLLANPDTPAARTLLATTTIGMIVPLNPDGAERNTRVNAQGIDINRDALAFATPEGRALRRAVDEFDPEYGFNLHNQHHRTAIGAPPAPAAVSLLAPPIDEENTPTDSTEEAARVAAYFCERVRDSCAGRVSRYDVEYMARAFGEWIQRRGVATILIEAGGWPGGDFIILERLHFAAFVQTLEAIAEDRLGDADVRSYQDLQRSSGYHLFDLLVQPAGVAQAGGDASGVSLTEAEVGVDFPHRKAGWYEFRDGVIRGVGDLHENGGLAHHDCPSAVLAPGRIVLAEAADDVTDIEPADWDALTEVGATTALAQIDLGGEGYAADIERLLGSPPPINAAVVGRWSTPPNDAATLLDRLTIALSAGLTAVVGEDPADALSEACARLAIPLLLRSDMPSVSDRPPATLAGWLAETAGVADRLGWSDRGRIRLDAAADFVLIDDAQEGIDLSLLQAVYVGGTVVRDSRGPTPHCPGRWLRRSPDSPGLC